MAETKIDGLDNLVSNLLKFQKSFNGNVMAKALRKGANVIKNDAKSRAPYDAITPDGVHIRDDIKIRRDPNPRQHGFNEIMYIRPYGKSVKLENKNRKKDGKSKKKSSSSYYHIIEFGTARIKGARFMTKAWESQKDRALKVVISELVKDVDKQVAKIKA